ncbi:DUF1192 domain-containing protein [Methylobacterium sp. WL103]|uniref:DUF1192 domain-containing protein n=1 Tax=Methylobacterium sp. WL103 TaxID=2603891 RepID=UPI0011C6F063|nr:DUF1192 domain-containing protein [Methylobacterium sp. WL103]TXN00382.1 DUF1192 domain-containing protein [Methylobacterium sp. WL103]
MRDDDEQVKRPVHHEVGQPLDTLSVDEIDHRIALLTAEIRRLEAARTAKQDALGAADAFFKR